MSVVIGTAGHIDHGKTTLLRALTGIDADRLPEERRRGMTIDVGYAWLRLPDGGTLDFVDVPGHDRLVGNMLVGAGEVDAALLVVAADDGPRAQTLEHLELLDGLGIELGIAVVTKIDVVPPERVAEVVALVRAALGATRLRAAPIVAASAVSGEGLDDVRAALLGLAERVRGTAEAPGPVALAVDRVFAVRGRGTVVTGTLRGGPLTPGAQLRVVPGAGRVRLREVQVHGRTVEAAGPGGRVAANVVGAERDALGRGVVLAASPAVLATDRLLVALRRPVRLAPRRGHGPAIAAEPGADGARDDRWPAAGGTSVRLHLGTAEVGGALRRGRRDTDDLPSGEATAILRLERPVAASAGARFVLRRPSPPGMVAAGRVIDPKPPAGAAWRRATREQVAALTMAADAAGRDSARLELHGALPVGEAGEPPGARVSGPYVISGPIVDALEVEARRAVAEHAAAHPDAAGMPLAELRPSLARALRRHASVPAGLAEAVAAALLSDLVSAGLLGRTGELLHGPERAPGPSPALAAAMDRLESLLAVPAPPALGEAARAAECSPEGIRALEAAGRIVRVDDDLAWAAGAWADLAALAVRLASAGPLTPAAFRDASTTSRRVVMPLLEDLDRRGILRRTPEGRRPGPRAVRGGGEG